MNKVILMADALRPASHDSQACIAEALRKGLQQMFFIEASMEQGKDGRIAIEVPASSVPATLERVEIEATRMLGAGNFSVYQKPLRLVF